MSKFPTALGILTMLCAGLFAGRSSAATCESIASLKLPDTTVTLASVVPAGAFTPPAPAAIVNFGFARVEPKDLPEFCRIVMTIRPSSDSDIQVEVWMPASGWNHKYVATGNGGWAGSIGYGNLAGALHNGYAVSSTDTGHTGRGGNFAAGHPEKLIDFAYRSEHEMTVKSKAVIEAYYGEKPRFSYWNSCSSGGRQGFKEAQMYPDDFDGIIAGASTVYWTGRAVQSIWIAQAVHKSEASFIPPEKLAMLHAAVLAACDAQDGVKDGVIEDPPRCAFDPQALECRGDETASCLTPPQVETARAIYSAVVNPRTREVVFPGHERGSELGWTTMAGPAPFGLGLDHFKYVVFRDAAWDYKTFDFDRDVERTWKTDGGLVNALDPNLRPFFERGGKLLQYHGWSDPQVSPRSSVFYYNSVAEALGGADRMKDSYRLFMVPGMAHCGGGEGINAFDPMAALEQWVEHGKAPDRILGSRVVERKTVRTRPLCPYPQVAKYDGTGSTDDASHFSCSAP